MGFAATETAEEHTLRIFSGGDRVGINKDLRKSCACIRPERAFKDPERVFENHERVFVRVFKYVCLAAVLV